MVLGDDETALAVIDALRMCFTGRIVVIPARSYGQFENLDIMKRHLAPLTKNQCFLVEDDYLDRANIDIIKGDVRHLDIDNRQIIIKGQRKPIDFEKVIVAWGAEADKLQKSYSNVHYIEDRFTHAAIHNKLIAANKVVVLGNTFEAVQLANSAREYLDEQGRYHTKIILMTDQRSEVRSTLGTGAEKVIARLLRAQRISYLPNVNITDMKGDSDLQAIHFNKEEDYGKDKVAQVEYVVEPDVVICANGIGQPRKSLVSLVGS